MAQGGFSANGSYKIDVDASVQSQNRAGNYSIIYWRILVIKTNAYGHMATTNMGNNGRAESNTGQVWANGNMAYEFRNGSSNGTFVIAEGTFRVNHNSVGEGSYYFSGWLNFYSLGSASATTGWRNLPRLATNPAAPTAGEIVDITQTSFRYNFINAGDGGLPIREWQVGWGRNSNYPEWFTDSWGVITLNQHIEPNTHYWVWSRGRNDIGWSNWSAPREVITTAGAFIKINGNWRQAVPYIKSNGRWVLAQPYVKRNGVWVREF